MSESREDPTNKAIGHSLIVIVPTPVLSIGFQKKSEEKLGLELGRYMKYLSEENY